MKILVTGHTGKDVELQRIMDFLKQDAEAMVGRNESDETKPIQIQILVAENESMRGIVDMTKGCGGNCTCNEPKEPKEPNKPKEPKEPNKPKEPKEICPECYHELGQCIEQWCYTCAKHNRVIT